MPAAAANASAEAGENGARLTSGAAHGKSGFGQVMSVLTTLLQEAAARQATGASGERIPTAVVR